MQLGNTETVQTVFVVRGLKMALLGKPAIEKLGLIERVNTLEEKMNPEDEFPIAFKGLGKLSSEFQYTIQLKNGAEPFSLNCLRRIPIPLKDAVQEELKRMVELGVISPVKEPTDWCAGMVVVPKSQGKVRICVDLSQLNTNVKRERYILPAVEHTLGQLAGAKIFSKLDANSGFWQIELNPESRLLTTFITPFGRFCFNRLPFGISSAPEIFERTMRKILQGLSGVAGQTDDTLVFGEHVKQHDERLSEVLRKIKESGLTLNKEKCEFRKTEVEFLGQKISAEGVLPCSDKVVAVKKLPIPKNTTEIKRFLGMVNYMNKFVNHLSEKVIPLTELLQKSSEWVWGHRQQKAFDEIKCDLSEAPILALYDCTLQTRITTDASSYGLGAVLEQKQRQGLWKPVAYASKTLTETQKRYSQIEKEGLGITWGCEKFKDFLIGIDFHIITDHKPLVPLFSTKQLDELSPRLQRFRMRLMRYSYTISHLSGKDVIVADALSRAPLEDVLDPFGSDWENDLQSFVNSVIETLPATANRLEEIKRNQLLDPVCCQLRSASQKGWEQKDSQGILKSYWPFRGDFTFQDDLLLKGCQLVIPKSMQTDILNKIHEGHQGMSKCKRRAQDSVWWLGMSKDIKNKVIACQECQKDRKVCVEPLIPSRLPDRPWQKVGADLMEFKGNQYLIVVDYFSRFPILAKLGSTTSNAVISHLQSMFAMHGIPECVMSDNGPQFNSRDFEVFSKDYNFRHITSSPHYPQSNGLAEATVKTVKSLLKRSSDPYKAILAYRATPLEQGASPAELLMGRRLRTTLPEHPSRLKPKWPDLNKFKDKDKTIKCRQKRNFDSQHGAKTPKSMHPGDLVWLPDSQEKGVIKSVTPYPRSYLVDTPGGTVRRNSKFLRLLRREGNTPFRNEELSLREERMEEDREEIIQLNEGDENQQVVQPVLPFKNLCVVPSPQTTIPTGTYQTRSGRPSIKPRKLNL